MPLWQLTILIEEQPALAAVELIDAITAARAPWLKRDDWEYLIETLRDMAGIEKPIRQPIEVVEHDPTKAADYFRSMGMIVVESA